MVILYSTGCPKCRVLETKLSQKHIPFTIVDDMDELISIGLQTVPILKVENTLYQFKDANDWINAQEVSYES